VKPFGPPFRVKNKHIVIIGEISMECPERRWSTRRNLYLSVDLQVPFKGMVPAALLEINLNGAFIETQVLLPVDTALTIKLNLPDNFVRSSFRINIRIVHSTSRGMGVAFVGMRAGVINALIKALSTHEKQPVPVKPSMFPGFAMNDEIF
jgi:hypothetical protein